MSTSIYIYIYTHIYICISENTPPHLAIPVHPRPLIWRLRAIMYLKHTPSFGESGPSYIFNTSPHLAIPVHSYILNTPHHLAMPIHHTSQAHPFVWRFLFIIDLKPVAFFGDCGLVIHLKTHPLVRRFRFILYLKCAGHVAILPGPLRRRLA